MTFREFRQVCNNSYIHLTIWNKDDWTHPIEFNDFNVRSEKYDEMEVYSIGQCGSKIEVCIK